MRMQMPAQAKKVLPYRDPVPLFVRHRIEDHLSQIYSPVVPLKSGGYLVINQTEALVAVDVNSGRSTRERNIETTALKTNLEAAEETCRQLRLRDLAGLVVIDFIDMDEAKNNRAVEKKLKDCLKDDRARVQIGKISSFGLMELSRQRRRTGILEGTTHVCPHCQGAGRVRSVESSALSALRAVEMEALRGGGEIVLRTPKDVGVYILNAKRDYLIRIRQGHGLWVNVALDESLGHAEHQIDRISSEAPPTSGGWEAPAAYEPDEADLSVVEEEDADEDESLVDDEEATFEPETASQHDDDAPDGRSRRRRRRRGRRGEDGPSAPAAAAPVRPQAQAQEPASELDAEGRRRRRRGRRGGRRAREDQRPGDAYAWAWPARPVGDDAYQWRGSVQALTEDRLSAPPPEPQLQAEPDPAPTAVDLPAPDEEMWVELPATEEKPKRPRRARGKRSLPVETPAVSELETEAEAAVEAEAEIDEGGPPPAPTLEVVAAPPVEVWPELEPALAAAPVSPPAPDPAEISTPPAAPRRGWWRRGA
jgi:ribonuclease E